MLILLAQVLLQPHHKTTPGSRSGWKTTIFSGLIFKPDHFPILGHYKAPQAAVPVQIRRYEDKNEHLREGLLLSVGMLFVQLEVLAEPEN